MVHVAATREPTSAWVTQQLRNATPFGVGPRFIIRDRDDKYGQEFDRAAAAVGARVLKRRCERRERMPCASAFWEACAESAWIKFSCSTSATYLPFWRSMAVTSMRPGLIRACTTPFPFGQVPLRVAPAQSSPSPFSTASTMIIGELRDSCGWRRSQNTASTSIVTLSPLLMHHCQRPPAYRYTSPPHNKQESRDTQAPDSADNRQRRMLHIWSH